MHRSGGHVFVSVVSTHSRLKAAGFADPVAEEPELVSTHSRLKAAGMMLLRFKNRYFSFNTQPPKGGWWFLLSQKARLK